MITEARYAGQYKLDDVLDQYMRAQRQQQDKIGTGEHVQFHSAHINKEGHYVLSRFHVNRGGTEDEVREDIKQFHNEYNVPYGEIVGITELDDDWSVYVRYNGPR